MNPQKLIFSALILALSAQAAADEGAVKLNFIQLDGAAGTLKVDNLGSVNTKGYEIEGSYSPMSQLLLNASFATIEEDTSGSSDEIDTTKAGVSWLPATGDDQVSINVGLRFREDKIESESVDGWGLGLGVRAMANDSLEISAGVAWLENDYSGSIDAEIGAAWHFTDMLAVSLAYEQLDFKGDLVQYTDRQWQLGARLSF
jgi:opacity protein-like surface antigen